MAEPIRPSTVLPANRSPFTLLTADGQTLVGEVASPIGNSNGAILCLHPLPTAGGMMDSHVYKKAANRLPDMAGITVVRFNTRGTTSANGTSTGTFDNGVAEKFDVEAALTYCLDTFPLVWLISISATTATISCRNHARPSSGARARWYCSISRMTGKWNGSGA